MKEQLNPQQLQAVSSDQSCVVIAGPGTGKTHTLIAKLKYLLKDKKIPPQQIMALTFTKKAAEELKSRLNESLSLKTSEKGGPFIGTIHAWCYQFLKQHHPDWQDHPKEIISEAEQKRIIKEFKPKGEKVKDILDKISLLKQTNDSPIDGDHRQQLKTIIDQYQHYLKTHHLVDFDDLLLETLDFLQNPPALDYQYILVDEFQDLNQLQFQIIIRLLKISHAKIFVVGDPYQSIYGFRGASPQFFNQLKSLYKPQTVNLTTNYRSTQNILDLSDRLFSDSRVLRAVHDLPSETRLLNTTDHLTEAYWISKQIQQLTGAGDFSIHHEVNISDHDYGFRDIAILYRTHSLSESLEKQLAKDTIPYQVIGEKTLLEYSEIEQIVRILELINQPELEDDRWLLRPQEYQLITDLKSDDQATLHTWIDLLIMELSLESSSAKKDRLDRLKIIALQYGNQPASDTLSDFLLQLKMLQTPDEYQPEVNKVTLSTMHAAKGLEFGVVFIIGLEEGLLPYHKSLDDEQQLEEERRLLYVGITRAKQQLYLTLTRKRAIHNQIQPSQSSRFLQSLTSPLLHVMEDQLAQKYQKQKAARRKKKQQMQLF